MKKLLTIRDAAEQFGLKPVTIRNRLLRDAQRDYSLHGSKKIGRDWFVTEAYIKNREWRNRKNV